MKSNRAVRKKWSKIRRGERAGESLSLIELTVVCSVTLGVTNIETSHNNSNIRPPCSILGIVHSPRIILLIIVISHLSLLAVLRLLIILRLQVCSELVMITLRFPIEQTLGQLLRVTTKEMLINWWLEKNSSLPAYNWVALVTPDWAILSWYYYYLLQFSGISIAYNLSGAWDHEWLSYITWRANIAQRHDDCYLRVNCQCWYKHTAVMVIIKG